MERDRAGRLVGREFEVDALDRLLVGLPDGLGGELVLVSGEPGIGKSSILGEVGRHAERLGYRALRGACWEGEAPSYWPWRQVLRQLGDSGGRLEEGPARRLLQLSAGVGRDGRRDESGFDLYDAVSRAIVAESARAPLVVLLDDLQWADDESLRLLAFLRRASGGKPVLLVGAYRDSEVGPELETLLPGAISLSLTGLDDEAVITVMTDVAGPRPPEELAARVARLCRGNPFFVRETARLAFTSGGGWVEAIEPGEVPAGVRAVLRRRLDQVSPACRELLALVAVAGGDVERSLVASASGDQEIDPLLDQAEQARIVAEDGERVGFVHDLFRQVVLAELSPAAAADLHGRLGTALASTVDSGANTSTDARGRLAVHFAAAGDSYAAEALRRSLTAAESSLTPEEACRHYERALALLVRLGTDAPDGSPDRLDLELRLAAGRAQAEGGVSQARGDLAAVAAAARVAGRADLLAEAALATHALGARTSTQVLTGLALLEDALAVAPAEDRVRASRLRSARSRVLSRLPGRHAEAWSCAREAAALAQDAGDRAAEFDALLAQHDLLWTADGRATATGVVERSSLCDELVEVARDDDTGGERLALAHQLRAAVMIELGDPEGLVELTRHCELADALGTARGRWWATSRRAVLASLDGRVDDALALTTDAARLGTMIGVPDAIGCDQSLRAALALLGVNGWGTEVAPPPDDPLWKIRHVLTAAHALITGDTTAAQVEVARGLPGDESFLSTDLLAIAAWVWTRCGTDPERERLLSLLEPWAGRHLVVGGCASYYGPVDRLRGDLAAALGRRAEALALHDAARAAARGLGALAWAPDEPARDGKALVLDREGTTWRLSCDGRVAHLPDAKGLQDLATLVANPGRDVHVLTLLGRPGPTFGADAILDEPARTAYRARLQAIDAELDDADRTGDSRAGEELSAERAALVSELTAATGLGGRRRRLADESERARKTVGARLRDSLRRVEEVDPELGGHLRASVRIGTVCRYTPEAVRSPE